MDSATVEKFTRLVEMSPFVAPVFSDEVIAERLVKFLLTELVPVAFQTVGSTFEDFGLAGVSTVGFREDVYVTLVERKVHLQEVVNDALDSYRKQVRVMSQAFSRVYALQNAKEPSEKAIAAAAGVANGEFAKLGSLMDALRGTQCVEEYFRCVPSLYKAPMLGGALWVLMSVLRTADGSRDSVARDLLRPMVGTFVNGLFF